jgi:TldD protein
MLHSKDWTRRALLRAGALTGAACILPLGELRANVRRARTAGGGEYPLADADLQKQIALAAIDAAKAAGARYADVRVTRRVSQRYNLSLGQPFVSDFEELAIGVRVLINGGWGFASSPLWSVDEATRLARHAVENASANDRTKRRAIEMGEYPVATGTWIMPGIDPMSVPIEEKIELIDYLESFFKKVRPRAGEVQSECTVKEMIGSREERVVATTEGSLFSQVLYRANAIIHVKSERDGKGIYTSSLESTNRGAIGWEVMDLPTIERELWELHEYAKIHATIPKKQVEVGRYDVVCDGITMAGFVDATLARATQLDMTLGYEANASGTSYLGPRPLEHLGTLQIGTPQFTVTANRSMPNGYATVKWDDEGVEPAEFTLIKDGVLVDYQTTREQAYWLSPYYEKIGKPVRSNGCATSESALHVTMQGAPNLVMAPGASNTTFDELVSGIERGLALTKGGVETDFQSRSGFAGGIFREIVNGKLGAYVENASILFDSPQFWKTHLAVVGGPSSVKQIACHRKKGKPEQLTSHTVTAPAGVFKGLAIVRQSGV